MNEELIMLVWGIGLLSITWTTMKELKESNETLIMKAIVLVLTIAIAPLLSLLQGYWQIKD